MRQLFSYFTYAVLIIAGGWMFGITSDGHVYKICIACGSLPQILLGLVSVVTGVIGFIGNRALSRNAER